MVSRHLSDDDLQRVLGMVKMATPFLAFAPAASEVTS
jgi:hypothetical protein